MRTIDDAHLVQRLPTQRRAAATASRHTGSRSLTESPPPHTAASGSTPPSYTLPPSSTSVTASSRFSFLSSPYFALLVTLLLFLVVLSASSYVFLRLQRQHPDHLLPLSPAPTTSTIISPLLSEHPAYQRLQRELTGQYQQMLTLAKRYMDGSQWREFQAEAVRIDSAAAVRELQQQAATPTAAASCPPCPVCGTAATSASLSASSQLSELTGQPVMTDWYVHTDTAAYYMYHHLLKLFGRIH